MSKVDDPVRMEHMLEAILKALHFAEGKQRSDLDEDEILCLALVRLLEVIGEAASKVTQQTCRQYPEISWAKIVGMRNRLIHGYDQLDLEILWQTLVQDLQPLAEMLKQILSCDNSD